MRTITITLLLIIVVLFKGKGQNIIYRIELPFEKDLFPEGIAVDNTSKRVFLNSLKHNKIVSVDFNGKNSNETVSSKEHGYLSGFGMTIQGDTLYALGNSLPEINNTSILLLLSITNGELIKFYSLNNDSFIYLNDLAIASDGRVFITDSESNNIYTINKLTDQLEIFYTNDEIKHSNGIAISPDDNILYFASYVSGIRTLNIETKTLMNQPNDHKGIDGMKFHNNSLVAIMNGRRDKEKNGIFRFLLHENGTDIEERERIYTFRKRNDIPTTFAIQDSILFFVEDSQLDNFNQDTNEVIDKTKLEPYRLMKLNLSEL